MEKPLHPVVIESTTSLEKKILSDGKEICTLKAETYNGKSELRLDGVMCRMFEDKVVNAPVHGGLKIDKNVRGEIGVRYAGSADNIRYARGHVDLNNYNLRKILCTLPKLRIYRGFEHAVSIIFAFDGDLLYRGGDWTMHNVGNVDFDIFSSPVDGIPKDDFILYHGTPESYEEVERLPIQYINKDIQHPFYVRWINQLGGYDYWMFSCRQKLSRKLIANEYYEPYDSDGVKVSFHKEALRAVEVSSGVADKKTLELLADMPQSPDIRLYKKDTQEWMPIQVDKGDTEIMSDQSTGELVFSFIVPE